MQVSRLHENINNDPQIFVWWQKGRETHDKVQGSPRGWVQHRRYWVQWAGLSTVEEALHTEEHCDGTVESHMTNILGKIQNITANKTSTKVAPMDRPIISFHDSKGSQ